jgi:hypothetical protein
MRARELNHILLHEPLQQRNRVAQTVACQTLASITCPTIIEPKNPTCWLSLALITSIAYGPRTAEVEKKESGNGVNFLRKKTDRQGKHPRKSAFLSVFSRTASGGAIKRSVVFLGLLAVKLKGVRVDQLIPIKGPTSANEPQLFCWIWRVDRGVYFLVRRA